MGGTILQLLLPSPPLIPDSVGPEFFYCVLSTQPQTDSRTQESRHFQIIPKILNLMRFFSLSWNILSFTFFIFGDDNLICNFKR